MYLEWNKYGSSYTIKDGAEIYDVYNPAELDPYKI